MEIEIQKVELAGRFFLKWDYNQKDGQRTTKIKSSADSPVHDDLEDAIQALVPDFVLLTEMKKKSEVAKAIDLKELPEDLLAKYKVRGVSIDDNKGDISYRIWGVKFLNTGKQISFESPRVRVSADGEDKYEFIEKLVEKVETIKEEVLEYMNGKEAMRDQTAMDFGDEFNPEVDQESEEHQNFEETAA